MADSAKTLAQARVGTIVAFVAALIYTGSQAGSVLALPTYLLIHPADRDLLGLTFVAALVATVGPTLVGKVFGVTPSAAHLRGSARWADARDVAPLVLPDDTALPTGAMLLSRGPVVRTGLLARQGSRLALSRELVTNMIAVLGRTGSGKTYSIYLPNLAEMTGSVVATDPKSELYRRTSGYHREARRFAPRDPGASAALNWIPLCTDHALATLCARALLQQRSDAADSVWQNADRELCAALFAHIAATTVPTPMGAYRLIARGPEAVMEAFRTSASPRARSCAALMGTIKAELLAVITMAVRDQLAFLEMSGLDQFTSSSLEAPDFGALRRRPIAVYWCCHEQDTKALMGLSSLFFALLLDQLSRDTTDHVPVTIMLDEFANIGRLPGFEQTIAVLRGRGVGMVLGLQARSQLRAYGEHESETIWAQCRTKVFLPGLDSEDAQWVSRELGEETVRHQVRGESESGGTTWTEHLDARPLLTPDEVRRLDDEDVVILTRNLPPILATRLSPVLPPSAAPTSPLGPALDGDARACDLAAFLDADDEE